MNRVIYWPFALPDRRLADASRWLCSALADLGIEAHVDPWLTLDGHRPADLMGAELLFVGGGTTSKLARHVFDHGFGAAVRNHVGTGGNYYGGSAGALLACDSIALSALADGDAVAARDYRGLGLVHGVTVLPHANAFAVDSQHEWSTSLGQRLLAIPEASGVKIGDATCSVIGGQPVTFVDGNRITVYQPGEMISLDT